MKISKTSFEGLIIIEPRVFDDNRGFFFESYNKKSFQDAGMRMEFVQDNESHSHQGVLRGMHFQKPPFAQTKLVRVLSGIIQDVVVDLRKTQPTFGKYYSMELSVDNKRQLLIPKGFAHGFLVLSEFADVFYKCDEYYHPEAEDGLLYNDPKLNIEWPIEDLRLSLSKKDLSLPVLSEASIQF